MSATPPVCLNCGCPWDSCLIHSEFCCDACAHFDPPGTGSSDEGRRRARAIYEQARRDRADAIAVTEEKSA